MTNAGEKALTITIAGWDGSTTKTFTINKASVTVSGITAENKEYDGNTTATLIYTGASFEGKVGSDELSVSGTGAFADANVGTGKTVNISGLTLAGSSAGNYQLAATGQQSEATASITAKEVGLEWTNTQLTYNGSEQAPTATATGTVNSDNIGVTVTGGQTNVGNYTATALALTGDKAGNYTLPAANTQAFTIAKATYDMGGVTFTGGSYQYDGTAHSLAIGGDLPSGVTVSYSDNNSLTDVGSVTVTASFTGDANHNDIANKTAALAVTQKEVGLSWSNTELTYNGDAQKPMATATGIVSGDKIAVTVSGEQTNVGTGYTATATELTGGKAGNYKLPEQATTTFSITNATMTGITATAYNAPYDGEAHGITLSGVPEGSTVTFGTTEGTYDLSTAPTYTDVAASCTVYYKVSKTNYNDFTGSSTVTITQAENSFTTQPSIEGWTYGAEANTPAGGVAAFGTDAITYKYCATADGTYGTYNDVVNGQAGSWYVKGFVEATTNYAAATSDAIPFTITAATLTVTAADYSGTYDGQAHGITVTAEGATIKYREGDTGEYNLTASPTLTNVGTKTVYYEVTKDNYETVTGSKTITINKATLTVDESPTATAEYGTAVKNIEVSGGAVKFGETAITGTWAFANDDDAVLAVGNTTKKTATFTPSEGADNYNVLTIDIAPVITAANIVITANNQTLDYNGTAQVYTGYSVTQGSVEPTVTYYSDEARQTAIDAPTNVGTYYVRVSVTGNYTGQADATLAISKVSLAGAVITGIDESYAFTNAAITPAYTVTFNSVAVASTEFDAVWSDNTNVGTATLTLTAKDDAVNFTAGTQKTATFTITNPTAACGDNLTYVYDPVTNTIVITGTGEMTDYNNGNPAPWAGFIDANTTVFAPTGVAVDVDAILSSTDVFNYAKDGNNITITNYTGSDDPVTIPTKIGNENVSAVNVESFTGEGAPSTVLIPEGIATTGTLPATSETDFFTYEEKTVGENTTATIKGYVGNSDVVEIPTKIGNTEVTKIEGDDFKGENAPTVIVPKTVADNSEEAFGDDSSLLTYEKDADTGEITINGYTGNDDVVTIPTTIDGGSVTGIDQNVFTGENVPKTVLVPETVTDSEGAFADNTDQFVYKEETDGTTGETTATITGYTGNSEVVEVPTTIGGNEVTKIDEGAFTGESTPGTVLIKDGTEVADGAFDDGTTQLTYEEDGEEITITGYEGNSDVVEIPSTIGGKEVTKIDEGTFTGPAEGEEGSPAPSTVLVPNTVTESDGAFDNDKTDQFAYEEQKDNQGNTTGVTITGYTGNSDVVEVPTSVGGNDVTTVAEGAFTGDNDSPKTVLIEDGITSTDATGDNTSKLTYKEEEGGVTITGYEGNSDVVEIPSEIGGAEVTKIDNGAFTGGTDSPATVLVPDGTTVENCALPASTSQLTYKEDTDSETGEKSIEITGYTGGTGATSVEIPAEIGGTPVTTIADDAFSGSNLEEITVPETVNEDVSELANVEVTQEMGGGITMKTKTEGNTKQVNITEPETVSSTNYSKPIPATIEEASLTYTRTLTKSAAATASNMYTVCLPFTPPTNDNLKYYTLSTGESDVLTFTEVTEPAANTPYLVVVSDDVSVGCEAQPVNLNKAISAVGDATATDGYQLCGTLRGMTHDKAVTADAYILQSDGTWKKVTDTADENKNAYIPPFRAYIVKTTSGSGARLYSVISDETPTGIDDTSRLMNNEETAKDGWYTLDGRLVNGKPSQKGVYVKANRKIVVNK